MSSDVPANDSELKHLTTVPAPIAGQGIAWDHDDPGILLGIVAPTSRSRLHAIVNEP